MKIIFEEGDLVCRCLFCKTNNLIEGADPGKLYGQTFGKVYGFKTDKPNVYHHTVVATIQKNGMLFGRTFGDVDCSDGLGVLNESYIRHGIAKHPEWLLGDEQMMSKEDMEAYAACARKDEAYKDVL